MDQFRSMLLAGASSDFVASLTTLCLAKNPAGLRPRPPPAREGIPVVAVAPGWMRTEPMKADHPPEELGGRTETPHCAARGVAALGADPDALRFTGRTMDVAEPARTYGFTDRAGIQSDLDAGRS